MRGINLENFLESSRDIGYTLNNAIADLVDNSIDASAKNIRISLTFQDNKLGFHIVDDGRGMTQKELENAMELSCANPNDIRKKGKLGKYGLGLKLSSFAFARILRVTSIASSSNITSYEWNLDKITETGFFQRVVSNQERVKIFSSTGTLVEWYNCDKLINYEESDYNSTLASLVKHISLTFGRLIKEQEITITLNGTRITAMDPFYVGEESTIAFPTVPIKISNSAEIHVTAFVIANLKNQKGSFLEEQGFYIYRNKRLIEKTGWLGLYKPNEVSKLARVRVDITNFHDDVVGVNINKTSINKVNPILKSALQKTAETARKKSLEYYRVKGKVLKKTTKDQVLDSVWLVKQIGKKKKLYINNNHPMIKSFLNKDTKKLFKLLEDTIPLETILSFEKEFDFEINSNNAIYLELGRKILNTKIQKGIPTVEAIKELATIEPFSIEPSLLEIIREGYNVK
jgi:hypothetical protein